MDSYSQDEIVSKYIIIVVVFGLKIRSKKASHDDQPPRKLWDSLLPTELSLILQSNEIKISQLILHNCGNMN